MTILQRTPIRCLAIALVVGLLFIPAPIPLRVLVLASAALLWTYLETRSLAPLGLGPHRPSTTVAWGVAIFVAAVAVGAAAQEVAEFGFGVKADMSGYGALVGNEKAALQLLAFAYISASIGEEILFRGFLLNQLSAVLGTTNRSRWAAIISAGSVFGLGHWIQGPVGVVTTGMVGMVFGWAWFRTDRNLWALILAHMLTDTFGIGQLYLGWYG